MSENIVEVTMSKKDMITDGVVVDKDHSFKIIIKKQGKVEILEFEDALFNLNCALLMPSAAREGDGVPEDQKAINGLEVLATVFKHLEKEKKFGQKKILLAGHTDASNEEEYNAKLSKMRADAVLYLLMGNTEAAEMWEEQFKADVNDGIRVYGKEDVKSILFWIDAIFGWGCNPDGKEGRTYSYCVKRFKVKFNSIFKPASRMDPEADTTKKKFWNAVFVIYQYALTQMLLPDDAEMPSHEEFLANNMQTGWMDTYHGYLKWAKNNDGIESAIGCGESWQIDSSSEYSQANRRVQVLFFDESELEKVDLDLCCQENCAQDGCPIYGADGVEKVYLWKITDLEIKVDYDDGIDPTEIKYRVYLNDDSTREGAFNSNGYAIEKDVPHGKHLIFIDAPGCSIDS
jgi:hypothetical protein